MWPPTATRSAGQRTVIPSRLRSGSDLSSRERFRPAHAKRKGQSVRNPQNRPVRRGGFSVIPQNRQNWQNRYNRQKSPKSHRRTTDICSCRSSRASQKAPLNDDKGWQSPAKHLLPPRRYKSRNPRGEYEPGTAYRGPPGFFISCPLTPWGSHPFPWRGEEKDP